MSKFVPIRDFIEMYEVANTESVDMAIWDGRYKEGIHYIKVKEKGSNSIRINYQYINKVMDYKQYVWNKVHYLYFNITEHMNTTTLATLVAKLENNHTQSGINLWNVYLSRTMFRLLGDSVTKPYLPFKLYRAYRYLTWIYRWIKRGRFRRLKEKNSDCITT